jgi:hypothetical protein
MKTKTQKFSKHLIESLNTPFGTCINLNERECCEQLGLTFVDYKLYESSLFSLLTNLKYLRHKLLKNYYYILFIPFLLVIRFIVDRDIQK